MSTLTATIHSEIRRLARKEARQEVEPLRKALATYKSRVRELNQDVATLKRQLAQQARALGRSGAAVASAEREQKGQPLRFRPSGLVSHRKRLGLSAANAATLIGVSPLTIYKWEAGSTRPRASHMPAIDKLRKMGRREVVAALEAASA
ncbi:helix-turn-helix domain-containing protein [Ramlibacter aquaticus]|uniref:Helix-turn-helix domain-containing protein n=1 Tax=Ramlibacter aquaticus TaxID=2780094 RepID=A0ABR9SBD8_9BURK|nr:helix-turn-helix domain-containing protein [Ramlibacter aquaticus]MBE7939672.1 helix-turn-helix domain-containing protein [Ramlibacter aquaticus]